MCNPSTYNAPQKTYREIIHNKLMTMVTSGEWIYRGIVETVMGDFQLICIACLFKKNNDNAIV